MNHHLQVAFSMEWFLGESLIVVLGKEIHYTATYLGHADISSQKGRLTAALNFKVELSL